MDIKETINAGMSKIVEANEKIAEVVVDGYKKIETGVVEGYKKIEDGVVEGYKKITLVDIRYMHPNLLENYIEFNSQDVLFLYSTSVLNNSETIK